MGGRGKGKVDVREHKSRRAVAGGDGGIHWEGTVDGVKAAAVAVGAGACDSWSVISWYRERWLARRKCAELNVPGCRTG